MARLMVGRSLSSGRVVMLETACSTSAWAFCMSVLEVNSITT